MESIKVRQQILEVSNKKFESLEMEIGVQLVELLNRTKKDEETKKAK